MTREFDFQKQLHVGQQGEDHVFNYFNSLQETVDVLKLTDHKAFQSYGTDGMLISCSELEDSEFNSTFFDVKTDFQYFRSGKLFLEIMSDTHKKGGILTSKAEFFHYYDPFGGKLFSLPLYATKRWYKRVGISMAHKQVKSPFGKETCGVTVAPENLINEGVPITIEDIGPLTNLTNLI